VSDPADQATLYNVACFYSQAGRTDDALDVVLSPPEFVQRRSSVVVEVAAGAGAGEARTDNNRVVNFAGDAALTGTWIDVTITPAPPHSLPGGLPP